ncbi:MAG TPA: class I SAM-dependent methyltransferase [Catalimonadaceae bacterium]|nr:class I SAM-dependent methyltransferase [Catalimonadaceae bacterium]
MSSQVSACKICQAKSNFIFGNLIRKKYSVNFYQCSQCGFVQPDEPFWLDEAYSQSMNLGDTGQVVRSLRAKNVIVSLVFLWFDKFAKFLDFASGYGFFVRIMRDVGLDYYWSDKYTENLLAFGFEGNLENSKFELVTIFECFEHWANPVEEIEAILKCTSSILFTTNVVNIPAPRPSEWWYYGFDHGQHVAFYSRKSLEVLAKKFGLNFYTKNGFHLLTDKKINYFLYKFIIVLSTSGMLSFLGKFFKSKTQSDSEFLISD